MKNLKSKQRKTQMTKRDYEILRFIWKWKVISTAAVAQRFFPKRHAFTAYTRLCALQRNGFLKSNAIREQFHAVWTLDSRGFRAISSQLGDLESKGFKSEFLEHDFLATAFHLGEWLIAQPPQTKTFSEQQLRRIHQDLWPAWVPKSSIHRADGYSLDFRTEKPMIYAFETELSIKAKHRYESAVAFYDSEATVSAVLWLVSSKRDIKRLRDAFDKFKVRSWGKHNFILLEDFQKSGWKALVVEGNLASKCLEQLLIHKGQSIPNQSPLYCSVFSLLDSRKRPVFQARYKNAPDNIISD